MNHGLAMDAGREPTETKMNITKTNSAAGTHLEVASCGKVVKVFGVNNRSAFETLVKMLDRTVPVGQCERDAYAALRVVACEEIAKC